ncbi:MAG: YggS family pyridoxal phosphate-dependent enzyme [Gemmatimonadota bacterium]|jgi:pyridoxal phosphate enzyme (YggS family)|nr:YggS family pyridoxal phosphate-dependent enzyme [Gemmatimonadota bacterium]
MMDYSGLPARLAGIRDRIEAACHRVGRDPRGVEIVAVTKTHPVEAVRAALAAGLVNIGENRVQELESKVDAAGVEGARWHLIGHLQRNKARQAIELADLIHSVDSIRLAQKLSEEAVDSGRQVEVLVQVNVSGEETKGGLEGPGTLDSLGGICLLPGLRVVGLMTMAPFTADEGVVREVFRAVRRLAEEAGSLPGFQSRHLSMGMSGDFELAVEEGSTLVRIGTALLGERDP